MLSSAQKLISSSSLRNCGGTSLRSVRPVASVQLVISRRARISSSSPTCLAAQRGSPRRGIAPDSLSPGGLETVMSGNVRLLPEVTEGTALPVPWHASGRTVSHGNGGRSSGFWLTYGRACTGRWRRDMPDIAGSIDPARWPERKNTQQRGRWLPSGPHVKSSMCQSQAGPARKPPEMRDCGWLARRSQIDGTTLQRACGARGTNASLPCVGL
jgi:hypothetical protein